MQDLMSTLIMLAIMFGIMWLMLIRPAKKRQQQLQTMQNNLQRGDKVMTSAGLHGVVDALEDRFVHVRIAKDVVVKYERQAIGAVLDEQDNPVMAK